MNKTENPENVGKHQFEVAGLGLAPYRFLGVVKVPGSCCDFCGTGIVYEFHICSADGKEHKVGCDCIAKVGDKGILEAYRSTPEYRKAQREKRHQADLRVIAALNAVFEANKALWESQPHPWGPVNFYSKQPQTYYDYMLRRKGQLGATGRAAMLRKFRTDGIAPQK